MDYRTAPDAPQPDRSILVAALNCNVYGIDRATGEARWQHDLGGYHHEVSIAVGYGVVVASASTPFVYCLDYLTGAVRWKYQTREDGRATILLEPDQIIVGKGGYVDCFAPTGHKLWQQPLEGMGFGHLALGYPGNVVQADRSR